MRGARLSGGSPGTASGDTRRVRSAALGAQQGDPISERYPRSASADPSTARPAGAPDVGAVPALGERRTERVQRDRDAEDDEAAEALEPTPWRRAAPAR